MLLDHVLEYSRKHSQVVILILVGVMVAGSIAGGIYIQNLKAMLIEQRELERLKAELIKERHRTEMGIEMGRYFGLQKRTATVETAADHAVDTMSSIIEDVDSIAKAKGLPATIRNRLVSIVERLRLSEQYARQQLAEIKDIKSQIDPIVEYGERVAREAGSMNLLPVFALFVVAFVASNILFWRHWAMKKHRSVSKGS